MKSDIRQDGLFSLFPWEKIILILRMKYGKTRCNNDSAYCQMGALKKEINNKLWGRTACASNSRLEITFFSCISALLFPSGSFVLALFALNCFFQRKQFRDEIYLDSPSLFSFSLNRLVFFSLSFKKATWFDERHEVSDDLKGLKWIFV